MLLTLCAVADAQIQCTKIKTSHLLFSWQKWVSANPSRLPNLNYAKNSHEALVDVFIPWVKGRKTITFEEMLREMHRQSAIGAEGDSNFSGQKYSTADIFPGKTRADLWDPNLASAIREQHTEFMGSEAWVDYSPQKIINKFLKDKDLNTEERRFFTKVMLSDEALFDPPFFAEKIYNFHPLSEAIKDWKAGFPILSAPPPSSLMFFQKGPHQYPVQVVRIKKRGHAYAQIEWSLDLQDIPANRGGKMVLVENGPSISVVPFRTPLPMEVPAYLRKAGRIMEILRKDFSRERNLKLESSAEEVSDFFAHLADYYQVLIAAHPFVRVNQSLFMNQLNYFLSINGYTPIYHGQIDFWAMVLPRKEFRRFLFNEVIDQQEDGLQL